MNTHEFNYLNKELEQTNGIPTFEGSLVIANGEWCAICKGAQSKIKSLVEREFWKAKDLSESGRTSGIEDEQFPSNTITIRCALSCTDGDCIEGMYAFDIDINECSINYRYSGGYYDEESEGTPSYFYEPSLDEVRAEKVNVDAFAYGHHLQIFDTWEHFKQSRVHNN